MYVHGRPWICMGWRALDSYMRLSIIMQTHTGHGLHEHDRCDDDDGFDCTTVPASPTSDVPTDAPTGDAPTDAPTTGGHTMLASNVSDCPQAATRCFVQTCFTLPACLENHLPLGRRISCHQTVLMLCQLASSNFAIGQHTTALGL